MNILLSNDDGVLAPGLTALAQALSSIATVIVMAPDRNRSGASHSLTLSRPLRVCKMHNGFYSVEGTPTDCVHLALRGYLDVKIDMVISGINHGSNLGDDVIYSGTVAAAVEGRNLGLPAIAVSQVCGTDNKIEFYQTAALVIKELVIKLKKVPLPSQTILNVNVPHVPDSEIKGFEITRLGSRHAAAPIEKQKDPRGHPIYWIGPPGAEADAGPGTDFNAVIRNYVSITPLHLDMTHYTMFDDLVNLVK